MKREKVRILISLVALSFLILSLGCGTQETATQTEEKYTPVEITPAAIQTLVETTAFTGKVCSDREVSLVPKLPGKVTAVNVKVGDYVNAGTVLFTLDTQDLQKAVDMAAIGVQTVEVNYQRTKEQLEIAKRDLERQQQLYEAGAISRTQLEGYENLASETPLALVQTQLEQARLSLQQAQDALDNAVVTAPIAGTVSQVNVKYGEMTSGAQTAVTLTQLDAIYVMLDVPENLINSLKLDQEAQVNIPSVGDAEINGRVDNISPVSDARTQQFTVKVALVNKDGVIKPGMFAKVQMPTKTRANVLTIRSESIVVKNDQNIVYVVENDQAVAKEVAVGLDTGALVEITEGLQAGDKVISKGQTFVEQGSKVKLVGGSAS